MAIRVSWRQRGIELLRRITAASAAVAVALLVANVLLGVLARYVLRISLPWNEEVSRYLMVWLTMLGAAAAVSQNRLITVDTVVRRLPPRILRIQRLVVVALSLGAIVILAVTAIPLVFGPAGLTAAAGSGIQARWVRLALLVGPALMIVFLVNQTIAGRYAGDVKVEEPAQPDPGDELL